MHEPGLPTGTVTFLFTDIEGSTSLLRALGDSYARLLEDHRDLIRRAVAQHGGYELGTEGDSFFVAFERASQAVQAAVAAQHALIRHPWGDGAEIRVRMGLHTGEATLGSEGYVGLPVHQGARIASAAHGGQILVSATTKDLSSTDLRDGTTFKDLGRHRLKDFSEPEPLYQVIHPGLPADFPRPKTLEVSTTNLPLSLSSFVGREEELERTRDLLAMARLLTLTGPGGSGKTRLAIESATGLAEEYPDGVWFVDLAPVSEPDQVSRSVSQALGLREQPSTSLEETIASWIARRKLLLILDNCEHVVETCASLAERWLREAPNLRVLATSREPLGVPGEISLPVPPLSLPPKQPLVDVDVLDSEAVRLFVDRASAARPGFQVDDENTPFIAEICRSLDGIPLAIELAAAQTNALSVRQIAARLVDRFRLLTAKTRTHLPRRATLRATIDWSYDLLTEVEREVFCRLSVFAGGFKLEAAEDIAAGGAVDAFDVLAALSALVDKSLVTRRELIDGSDRYGLLQTLRAYGLERLNESNDGDEVRKKHADWFARIAERKDAEHRAGPARGFQRLDDEIDNFRAALEWSFASGHPQFGQRIMASLWNYWYIRGLLSEGFGWLQAAMDSGPQAPLLRAKLLVGTAIIGGTQGRTDESISRADAAIALAKQIESPEVIAMASRARGIAAWTHGDYERARAFFNQGLDWARRGDITWQVAGLLANLGRLAHHEGDRARARELLDEAVTIAREVQDETTLALALDWLASLLLSEGELDAARSLARESLTNYRSGKYMEGVTSALNLLGRIEHRCGNYLEAEKAYNESLPLSRRLGTVGAMISALDGLGRIAHATGRPENALQLFSAAEALRNRMGAPLSPSDKKQLDREIDAARRALSENVARAAWDKGRTMDLDTMIELALE